MRKERLIYVAIGTGLILLIPLVGMQLSDGWDWGFFDFVFAAVLLFGTGLAYEFIASKGISAAYRAAAGIGCVAMILLIWINGAVGIIGDGDVNLLYAIIPALLFFGSIITRLKAEGMSLVLFAAAGVQMLIPLFAFLYFQPPFDPGVIQVFLLNGAFATLFALSGMLFLRASEAQQGLA